VTAEITRPCISAENYLATWNWGDGEVTEGKVSCISPNEIEVNGYHAYDTPGVYTVRLILREDFVPVWESEFRYVTIYDPTGGFVTGGGWFESPPGACLYDACDNDTTGKASFGFVAKYKKGAQDPSGNTEFQFKAGGLNFHSKDYDWLVVAGSKAKFKGVGTINKSGLEYGFMISAIDADLNINDAFEIDRFRIRIWLLEETEEVIYDNQVNGDLSDDADPNIEINGGSITVHPDKTK
jgi:hypothetical protein